MKTAQLLAQYLTETKQLQLPGIGMFKITGSGDQTTSPVIHFENSNSRDVDANLISFISHSTGKMKALAAADFQSHLELIHEFLNIGKPFHLEGIGSIVRIRHGEYHFTQAEVIITERKKENRETSATDTEDKFRNYKDLVPKKTDVAPVKKPVMAMLVTGGLILAIAIGYFISRSNSKGEVVPKTEIAAAYASQPDTMTAPPVPAVTTSTIDVNPPGTYRFIVEVADRKRAFERLKTLKSWGLNIEMETKDSLQFNLFFRLNAQVADTSRILDSLSALYTPIGKISMVE